MVKNNSWPLWSTDRDGPTGHKKHEQGKMKLQAKECQEQEIADAMVRYNEKHHNW